MDVCKCIVPLRHGGTLISHRAACLLVRLVEGEENWEISLTTSRAFPLKIGMEPSKIILSPVRCSKLRLTTGIQLAPCHDEFRRPWCDDCQSGGISNNV
ncbi:uncharacterized protein TNCV_1842641 [Trichonephila clavipes]|nr:uncharacterized protein TNCV_1842641 [Trichonephila clavipes]